MNLPPSLVFVFMFFAYSSLTCTAFLFLTYPCSFSLTVRSLADFLRLSFLLILFSVQKHCLSVCLLGCFYSFISFIHLMPDAICLFLPPLLLLNIYCSLLVSISTLDFCVIGDSCLVRHMAVPCSLTIGRA